MLPLTCPVVLGSGSGSFRNLSRPCRDGPWSACVTGSGVGVGVALDSPFPGDGSPSCWPFSFSLVCDWNAAFPVNSGGFTIEALSHLNGCW